MNSIGIRDALEKIYNLESSSRLRAFEGLRAWAVIMVFNVHFFGQYYQQHYFMQAGSFAESFFKILHAGHVGVDLFFVLSGFLIFSTLNRNKPTFIEYMKHRIARIMPAHLVVLIAYLAVLALPSFPSLPWASIFANMFFLPTFIGAYPIYNYVSWTLGWEWLFYVLMFGILMVSGESRLKQYTVISAFLIFLSLIAALYGERNHWGEMIGSVIFPEPGRFAAFFVGVIAADLVAAVKDNAVFREMLGRLIPWAIIGVLAGQAIWALHLIEINNSFVLCNLFYLIVAICFGAIVTYLGSNHSTGWLNAIFQSTVMRIIGQISFSFYLIHVGVLYLLVVIAGKASSFIEMSIYYFGALLLTVMIATISFYFLERPYFLAKRARVDTTPAS